MKCNDKSFKFVEYYLRMSGGGFQSKGKIIVRTGPCSGSPWLKGKIPLDGRHYVCAGKIILKNGMELVANFEINTHTFDFLERNSVRCLIDGIMYYMNGEELYEKLNISKEDAIPYQWLPDVPLDYHKTGPYPMYFFSPEDQQKLQDLLKKDA